MPCFLRDIVSRTVVIHLVGRGGRAQFPGVMIQCDITCYHVDKYREPVAEDRSRFDRHMAWSLTRDVLLAFLHDNPRRDAVFSVLLRLRAPRFQQSDQADGRSGTHSGLHPDDTEAVQPLV